MSQPTLRQTLRSVSFKDNESETLATGVASDLYQMEMPNIYRAASRGEVTYSFLPKTAQPTTAFSEEQLSKQLRELYLAQDLTVTLKDDWTIVLSWN